GTTAATKPSLGSFPAFPLRFNTGNVPNYANPRRFVLSMAHMMSWTINGRMYDMVDMAAVAQDEIVYRDGTMAWEWVNQSPIAHPMHLHNIQFQVVQRTSPATSSYATISQGFVDDGWKDTVLVWPGEKVKIAMRFGPETGLYMYHCHILEHEDMGMMRNFLIA
ncbi:MAG: multicopper oxidase family protein, partial [Chloroflexota bacterium]